MFFDGSVRQNGAGEGVVLVSPDRQILPFSFVLGETCSNNAAEYQALIIGIYDVKKEDLLPYHQYASCLLERFDQVFLNHVPREENRMADALANLATMMALGENESTKVHMCHRWVIPRLLDLQINESHHTSIVVIEEEDWRQPLIEYLEHGKLPEDPRQRTDIKQRASRFIFYKGTLFRCSFEGLFLRCLDKEEAHQEMEEVHYGSCGAHQSASWPFDAWGLDVVGPLPKSSKGQMYILAATDYFSRWAEVVPLKEVKKEIVADFIKSNIIFRYGIPRYIITDNGTPFDNKLVRSLCKKFGFKQHKSSMYNAPANGLAEAFNKTLVSAARSGSSDWSAGAEVAAGYGLGWCGSISMSKGMSLAAASLETRSAESGAVGINISFKTEVEHVIGAAEGTEAGGGGIPVALAEGLAEVDGMSIAYASTIDGSSDWHVVVDG
ncbi:uncharacterized protein [Nicotiana tomentosiformis]|uniref:uncharacterized protein n=1 Tax=Nicotiana tomentosiformis TaxID=4098 RepID=UPI00388CEAD9